jgi:hypothetical protein
MKTTRQGKASSLRAENDPLLRNRRQRSGPMKQSSIEDGEQQQVVDAGGYQSIEPELYRQQQHDEETPPLLEIPEEIYAVRKAALKVLKPLNNTWVSLSFVAVYDCCCLPGWISCWCRLFFVLMENCWFDCFRCGENRW